MFKKNLISKMFAKRLYTKNRRFMSVVAVISSLMLVGCGANGEVAPAATDGAGASDSTDTISVVTTIFPEYDWVRQVAGDNENVEITMLLDNGVDLHSYQPTADDIMKMLENYKRWYCLVEIKGRFYDRTMLAAVLRGTTVTVTI